MLNEELLEKTKRFAVEKFMWSYPYGADPRKHKHYTISDSCIVWRYGKTNIAKLLVEGKIPDDDDCRIGTCTASDILRRACDSGEKSAGKVIYLADKSNGHALVIYTVNSNNDEYARHGTLNTDFEFKATTIEEIEKAANASDIVRFVLHDSPKYHSRYIRSVKDIQSHISRCSCGFDVTQMFMLMPDGRRVMEEFYGIGSREYAAISQYLDYVHSKCEYYRTGVNNIQQSDIDDDIDAALENPEFLSNIEYGTLFRADRLIAKKTCGKWLPAVENCGEYEFHTARIMSHIMYDEGFFESDALERFPDIRAKMMAANPAAVKKIEKDCQRLRALRENDIAAFYIGNSYSDSICVSSIVSSDLQRVLPDKTMPNPDIFSKILSEFSASKDDWYIRDGFYYNLKALASNGNEISIECDSSAIAYLRFKHGRRAIEIYHGVDAVIDRLRRYIGDNKANDLMALWLLHGASGE